MRSVSALRRYRRVPFNFRATPGPILTFPCQNKNHLQILVRQAHTKSPSSSLSGARFKIGYYSSLVVFMICLTVASETIDWILVHPLKSVYVKNGTHKSNDSSASYQYGILRKGCIRLISIKHGNWDDPIELEMNHVKFRPVAIYGDLPPLYPNVPTYEALSYPWGGSDKDTVSANKDKWPAFQPFSITHNLHSALLVFRNNFNPSLWIDAICLDQNDPFEKDEQLFIMYLIYINATRVLVWHGEDEKSVDLHAAAEIISHFSMKKRGWQWKAQSIAKKEPLADSQAWLQEWVDCDWHTGPEYASS